MDFEEDLPPAVAAWFVELHSRASPDDGDTVIRFQIELAHYTVTIQRDGQIYAGVKKALEDAT